MDNIKKPHEIKEYLDAHVIGQDECKKSLAIAIYNHYKRINNISNVDIDKSNILICGATGTGKTYLIKTLVDYLNVPCHIADASTLTASGYVGSDVETILHGLVSKANGDIRLAEKSICVIDEIDKIACKSENGSITRDVSGEDVQNELLKLIEGTVVNIQPGRKRKHPEMGTVPFNTKNVLFICMGAFVGLESKIKKRFGVNKVGFSNEDSSTKLSKDENLLSYLQPEDLTMFGLIPELIGRLPIHCYTNSLDEDALVKILTEPKNSFIKQYTELFGMDNCKITFDKDALIEIARIANKQKTGARSLKTILEKVLNDYFYDVPMNNITKLKITKKIVINKTKKYFK